MAKKKSAKKKSAKKKSTKKAAAKKKHEPQWTEAVGIQTAMADIEVHAIQAYMTNPECYAQLIDELESLVSAVAALVPQSNRCMSDKQCPPSWSCCNGICKQYCGIIQKQGKI